MSNSMTRRAFVSAAAAATVGLAARPRLLAGPAWPVVPEPTLTLISGTPRERGRQYGKQFGSQIGRFLDTEIVVPFSKRSTRDEMLRYAGLCARHIRTYSPEIFDEMEGMAEGANLRLEEIVAVTLHEEYFHQGILPKADHCTALALGPSDTSDQHAYVGQTWDWFVSLYGASQMLHWQRKEGPSLLAYAYPGLWVGAGMNSAGMALCWTSAESKNIAGPRVGIPSYVLIAQILYQRTLKEALAEARRARHAGWFTFVLADSEGRLANVEGSPEELVIEEHTGHLVRSQFGSRRMTRTPESQPIPYLPKVSQMYDVLAEGKGKWSAATLKELLQHKAICLSDPTDNPRAVRTIDAMLFDTTRREAYLSRAPVGTRAWARFSLGQG